jgi:hypothetical protein
MTGNKRKNEEISCFEELLVRSGPWIFFLEKNTVLNEKM